MPWRGKHKSAREIVRQMDVRLSTLHYNILHIILEPISLRL